MSPAKKTKTAAKKTATKKKTTTKAKVVKKKVAAKKTPAKKAPAKKTAKRGRPPRPATAALSTQKAKGRADAFKATRKAHSMEAAEDYTELVHDLVKAHGEARICDISRQLGVSHVTALRTVRRLQEEGFLSTSPHKPVVLTKKGAKVASAAKQRHETLVDFFIKLGVPQKAAEIDVEGVEHHISDTTMRVIKKFLKAA